MTGTVLALDQGTTSSRAILFDDKARPLQISQQPINLYAPKAGLVEQNAMQIWHTQISCAQDVIVQAGLLATDISSIAITNQRETTILWNKSTGQPVAPAIVWQDRRTKNWCDSLRQKFPDVESRIQQLTGLRIDPYFSASKIVWLLDNYPDVRKLAQQNKLAFGTVDSWLIYKLTGGTHVIDVTNASRTLMMDMRTLKWSEELLSLFDIPQNILPKIVASDADFGKTKSGLFAKQIPIKAVLGDQQAALFGQGCIEPGMAKNTYGTGCFMLMHTGSEPQVSEQKLLTTLAWQRDLPIAEPDKKESNKKGADAEDGRSDKRADGQEDTHQDEADENLTNSSIQSSLKQNSLKQSSLKQTGWQTIDKLLTAGKRSLNIKTSQAEYALEGSVFMAGAIVQWLKDNLGIISDSQDVESLAKQVESSESVVMIPAFTGLGAPHWKPDAMASISGLSRGTNKSHIARAALESIAFQTYDVLIAMQKDATTLLTELRVDGGASSNDLLMQFQADLLGVPILRPKGTETTAKGAALLAGINSGLYDELTIKKSWELDKAFEPKMSDDEKQTHLDKWQRALNAI